jgi:two-component system, sensor histidine kinase and response regulator
MIGKEKIRTTSTMTPTSSVFDLAGTLRRLGGDTGLLGDLVQLYDEDSPPLLKRLHEGVKAQRGDEVRHAAHSLRGLAANFGASTLTKLLLELEGDAGEGRFENASSLVDQISEESSRLQATLAPHRR